MCIIGEWLDVDANIRLPFSQGQSLIDKIIDTDVQAYCDIMKYIYKHQPIVSSDWPPRVGVRQEVFSKLVLLDPQERDASSQYRKARLMFAGHIDILPRLIKHQLIDIQDIFAPIDRSQSRLSDNSQLPHVSSKTDQPQPQVSDSDQFQLHVSDSDQSQIDKNDESLRVVIDGPPGIGKTTLCRKLVNMWANEELVHGQYVLVLYCPLRIEKIAHATEIQELLKYVYDCDECIKMTEWLRKEHGQKLLIIFDGWDDLSTELRQSSLPARIIRRELLAKCSVIVTSRSYASSSLLEITSFNRHVEVMGFSEKEVKAIIKGTLDKDTHSAEKLIKQLNEREDIKSLCCIPLFCSIVITVFQKTKRLPTTLTEFYENLILQTIRRHVKTKSFHKIDPRQLCRLDELPSVLTKPFYELSQFAYLNLKESNPRTTFSLAQLYQSLDQSVKEDYLGLMTSFTVIDEESYRFLHLSIQEFLAAWWITKREKTEEVFAKHFINDRFQLCLGFVAGLTHLEHESYQQYFIKDLNLHCKIRPLFGLDHIHSYFSQNLVVRQQHICCPLYSNKLNVLLLLLFESQNSKLCEVLSQNIKEHSLCLHAKESSPFHILFFDRFHNAISSPFDILCLNYFLRHFNTMWDYLELGRRNKQAVEVFTSKQLFGQCIRLEIELHQDVKSVKKMLQTSFFRNLQESYITLNSSSSDIARIFQQLLKLQHLKILHFKCQYLDFHL